MATTTTFSKSHQARYAIFELGVSDTTSAEMFKLPKGATVIVWIVNVKTAVAGGTTELNVGISTDPDYFLDAVDVSAKGQADIGANAVQPGHETSVITPVYASLGSGNTAGAVQVICVYTLDKMRRF